MRWIGVAALGLAAAGGSAQSLNIPGIGRVRVPTIGRPAAARPAAADRRTPPRVSSNPRQMPDGRWTCATSAELAGWGTVRIVRAQIVDYPGARHVPGSRMLGLPQWWQVEFEVERRGGGNLRVESDHRSTGAGDGTGRPWQAYDVSAMRQLALPAAPRAIAMINRINVGPLPARLDLQLGVVARSADGQPRSMWQVDDSRRVVRFAGLPLTCLDAPAPPVPVPAAAVDLRRPVQTAGPGVSAAKPAAGTLREAVYNAWVYSFGNGVMPDFEQAKAWLREAQRREAATGDTSSFYLIRNELAAFGQTDRASVLLDGLNVLRSNGWVAARYHFGIGATLGDPQAMAALGYVWGDGFKNPAQMIYYCRAGFLAARASRVEHELDAVNHFCPTGAFDDLMTPAERRANPASIARAAAKSGALQSEYSDMQRMASAAMREAIRDAFTPPPPSKMCAYRQTGGRLAPAPC
jgi:hypothetical protein